MYRISKVLNHNGVIVIDLNDQKPAPFIPCRKHLLKVTRQI